MLCSKPEIEILFKAILVAMGDELRYAETLSEACSEAVEARTCQVVVASEQRLYKPILLSYFRRCAMAIEHTDQTAALRKHFCAAQSLGEESAKDLASLGQAGVARQLEAALDACARGDFQSGLVSVTRFI